MAIYLGISKKNISLAGIVCQQAYRPIPVVPLVGIEVTTQPTKTVYKHGENFSSFGMVVTATYEDGSTKTVYDYIVGNRNNLVAGTTSLTISYTDGIVTKETTVPITVKRVLSKIAITTAPTKTIYSIGENFDSTGMVVTATYTDSSTDVIANYSIANGNSLMIDKTFVTISYTEDGVTKTTTQSIFVKSLASIAITTAPIKTIYSIGENFDSTGMIVAAMYTDGSTKTVTGYIITNGSNLAYGKSSVTISYTEDGTTKTATQSIAVKDTITPSLSVTTPPSSTKASSITISGTATDADSGISSITVTVGSTNYNASITSSGSWSVSVSLDAGYNSISVVVKDKAGNTTSSSTYTVKRLEFVTVYDFGTIETNSIGYCYIYDYPSFFPNGYDRCNILIVNGIEYDVVYSIDGSDHCWQSKTGLYRVNISYDTYIKLITLYFVLDNVYTVQMGYYQ